MKDILAGVAYIHEMKEVHRDLKPRNGRIIPILVSEFSSL